MLDQSAARVHHLLNEDLFFFAEHAPLLIKGKTPGLATDADGEGGALIKWTPNIPQRWMQAKAEEQRKRTGGWVRIILGKGRQQGGSTWTEGRFYHRVRSTPGTSASIIAHEGVATRNLFKMVERFHDNVHPALQPKVGRDNANELTFVDLKSEYRALTAGNEDAGRSSTAQLIHGSEVAYWKNDYAMQDSLLETVALLPGTEIILESTGNGPKGLFYDKAMLALRGIGDYIFVFVPWYWQPEYERDVPFDFQLDEEEREYAAQHFPDGKCFPFETTPPSPMRVMRKMAWRRAKILEFAAHNGGIDRAVGLAKFQRIYPSFPQEMFQATALGLVRADAITSARKAFTICDEDAPLILGVDPAGDSEASDRTVIAVRRGRILEEVIVHERMKPMRLAGIIDKLIKERHVDMVFVDNGHGEGTVDRLHEMGHRRCVQGIWFNEQSLYPEKYLNKRSEIIIEAGKWLNEGGVRIPDDDDVHADIAAMPMYNETSEGRKWVMSKREIKKALGRSPDIYDALALTFSYPVQRADTASNWRKADADGRPVKKSGGPLSTLARRRR